MGFLSSLTDAFTGAPAKQAAADTRGYLGGVQATGNSAIDTGAINARSAVGGGLDAGRGALGAGYTTSRGDVGAGADRALGSIGSGRDAALGYLDKGYGDAGGYYDAARGAYGTARADYDPVAALSTKYGAATTLGLNALGANGAAGQTSARDAFKAGPAYEFNRDQGLEAINRRRNMGGMLDSGNADRDAQTFGAGLASNQYDTWMNNLLGFTNPELQATSAAASGRAGVDQNLAGLNTTQAGAVNQLGQNKAGVATDAATAGAGINTGRAAMLSDLASKYGLNSANLEAGAGNTLAGIETGAAGQKVGLGTAIAQPYANTYGQEAAAQQGGSANLWNLGLNVAKLATGRAGDKAGNAAQAAAVGG